MTFSPTDKFENAYIERRDMQYSYDDGDLYHFLDTETWEETLVSHDKVDDNFKFVKVMPNTSLRSTGFGL